MRKHIASMMGGHRSNNQLTAQDQLIRMRYTWPGFKSAMRGERMLATGMIQPTALSEVYLVRIEYALGEAPRAYVLRPALRPRDNGDPIPHTYPGPRPCLYLPDSGEWTQSKSIAATIVPWLTLWLLFYEVWHATGDWLGGGSHPLSLPEDKQVKESGGEHAERMGDKTA